MSAISSGTDVGGRKTTISTLFVSVKRRSCMRLVSAEHSMRPQVRCLKTEDGLSKSRSCSLRHTSHMANQPRSRRESRTLPLSTTKWRPSRALKHPPPSLMARTCASALCTRVGTAKSWMPWSQARSQSSKQPASRRRTSSSTASLAALSFQWPAQSARPIVVSDQYLLTPRHNPESLQDRMFRLPATRRTFSAG